MSGCGPEPTLDVIVGCDCDPDRPAFGGTRYDTNRPMSWQGVREGVPRLREIGDRIIDDFGNPLKITWCIRSDLQMGQVYGDCGWPAAEFAALWRDLRGAGDELAWHPHVWRWDDRAHCWYQEIEDGGWIAECFEAGHRDLSRRLGQMPLTSRMGWEFHNNATMNAIRRLGIRVDFSAIPGRYTPGCSDRCGSRFTCHVDWRGTPQNAFVPAASDYRRPAQHEEPDGVWELPMTVLSSRVMRVARIARKICSGRTRAIGELRYALTTANCGASGTKLYVTMPPILFSGLVAAQVRQALESGHARLVTALHPDEMCVTGSALAALYHPRHLEANLNGLVRHAHRYGVRVRFTTPAAIFDTDAVEAPGQTAPDRPAASA